jgi:hypothetical protein
MAERMQTSRSQLDRLLAPDSDKVQLDTLNRLAASASRSSRSTARIEADDLAVNPPKGHFLIFEE